MQFKIFNGRTSFYQWDVNQKIIIEDLGENKHVHFKSEGERSALVLEARTENGLTVVDVPNKLLQSAGKIVVWVYVYTDAERYTVEQTVFNVIPRQKPSNYFYTETEVLTYKVYDERLQALRDEFDKVIALRLDIADTVESDGDIPVNGKAVYDYGFPRTGGVIDGAIDFADDDIVTETRENLGLATIAVSGSYNDLKDVPEIPIDSAITVNGTNPVNGTAVAAYVSEQIAAILNFEGVAF